MRARIDLDRKSAEEAYNENIENDRKNFEEKANALKERLRVVDERLYGLKDIDGCKQEAEQEMTLLLNDIEEERAEHYKIVAEMERAAMKKKEAKKQELLSMMKEVKVRLVDEANERLIEIKNTSESQHESTADLLHSKGLKATNVLKKNVEVLDKNRQLVQNLDISGELMATMKHREGQFQRQISLLSAKLHKLDEQLEKAEGKLVKSREEMTQEEAAMLDAVSELEGSLAVSMNGLKASKDMAEQCTEDYEEEIMCQQEMEKFLSSCLKDTRKQAHVIITRGGYLPEWEEERVWPSGALVPPRLNELTLAQRKSVLKFLLGEVQGYKLRVESFMERHHDESGKGKGKDKSGSWKGAVGSYKYDADVRLKTGIPGWDDYERDTSWLGTAIAASAIGEKTFRSCGSQTEENEGGGSEAGQQKVSVARGRGGRKIRF